MDCVFSSPFLLFNEYLCLSLYLLLLVAREIYGKLWSSSSSRVQVDCLYQSVKTQYETSLTSDDSLVVGNQPYKKEYWLVLLF